MRKFLALVVLVLVSGAAYAAPTCWDCLAQACEHSVAYPHKECLAGSTWCIATGECTLMAAKDSEEPWLLAEWTLAEARITVDASAERPAAPAVTRTAAIAVHAEH
ncbi:MAG TPA: hypothetical protein VF432_13460 [Thermoanaerobaculia bacterium]